MQESSTGGPAKGREGVPGAGRVLQLLGRAAASSSSPAGTSGAPSSSSVGSHQGWYSTQKTSVLAAFKAQLKSFRKEGRADFFLEHNHSTTAGQGPAQQVKKVSFLHWETFKLQYFPVLSGNKCVQSFQRAKLKKTLGRRCRT